MNQLRASFPLFSAIRASLSSHHGSSLPRSCLIPPVIEGSNLKQLYILRSFSSSQSLSYSHDGTMMVHDRQNFAEVSSESHDFQENESTSPVQDFSSDEDTHILKPLTSTTNITSSENDTEGENITQRLIRLSQTHPDEYTPLSERDPELLQKAKARYRAVLNDYRSNFSKNEYMRNRMTSNNWNNSRPRSNWNNRDNYSDNNNWRGQSRDSQERWFSTSTRVFQEDSITERVKRMSSIEENDFEGTREEARGDQRQTRSQNSRNKPYKQNHAESSYDDGEHHFGDSRPRSRPNSFSGNTPNRDEEEFDQRRYQNSFSRKKPYNQTRSESSYDDDHNFGERRPRSRPNSPRNTSNRDEDEFDQRRSQNNFSSNKLYHSHSSDYDHNFEENRPRRHTFSGNGSRDDHFRPRRNSSWNDKNNEDDSSGYQRRQPSYNNGGDGRYQNDNRISRYNKYNNDSRGRDYDQRSNYSRTNEPPYQRVFRRETEDERITKKYGRNIEDPSSLKTRKPPQRRPENPKSSGVVGDYSSFTPKQKVPSADADLDLSSILNQTDADTFGTLSIGPVPVKDYVGSSLKKELMMDEAQLGLSEMCENEEDDSKFLPDRAEKMTMLKLVKKVKLLVDEMKVKEAVDTTLAALEQGGFAYDNAKFVYIYNLLISSCAQVGYVKMAFKLFSDMKKRGFSPRDSTYTSLFNACSNSTWDAENNIQRMGRLRENLVEKGISPNQIVYHAMIKGYGRNGDIEAAFGIVDEMINSGQLTPNTETFNMLFQACITNTDNGFRHVLVTWRKMQTMQIHPNIYTFNLLVRAVRECGILPEPQLIEGPAVLPVVNKKSGVHSSLPMLPSITTEEESNDMLNLLCLNDMNSLQRINDRMATSSKFIEEKGAQLSYLDLIEALKQSHNRLAVFGGLRGFMAEMVSCRIGPNLKTVTELGQVIPPSDIGDLVMMMKTYKLNPDITFFNLMMKRYYDSNNSVGAKKLLGCLSQFSLLPNIMTWGITATGCKTKFMGKTFMEEMEAANFTPTIQIMGALLTQATKSFDPTYVYWVMEETNRQEIKVDTKFVLNVEEFRHLVQKGIVSKEMGKPVLPDKLAPILEDLEQFQPVWAHFNHRYNSWMKSTPVSIEAKDPWEENFQSFKKNRTHGTLVESEG